jgi:hypothetical protein
MNDPKGTQILTLLTYQVKEVTTCAAESTSLIHIDNIYEYNICFNKLAQTIHTKS